MVIHEEETDYFWGRKVYTLLDQGIVIYSNTHKTIKRIVSADVPIELDAIMINYIFLT